MAQRTEDRLLRGVAAAAELLVRGGAELPVLASVMRVLGEAGRADRAYLFENVRLGDGGLGMSQRVEWSRDGIAAQIDNPELQGLPYAVAMEPSWQADLEGGRAVALRVREMPPERQRLFADEGIKSLLLTPVLASSRLWGFVGFDDCRSERAWSGAERSILTAAAALIGAHVAWREADAERGRQEARFRSLVEGATDCIFELDASGRFIYSSPVFSEITGVAAEEAIGVPAERFVAAPEAERLCSLLGESARTAEPVRLHRVTLRHRDGRDVVAELSASPFSDDLGRHLGFRGTARDVTARVRDERLRAALFEISEASRGARDLLDLFRRVHGVLEGLMPARNMYVALWDEATQLLSFPYFVDEVDPPPPPRQRRRGLTEYVLRTGRTLLATPAQYDALFASGEVEAIGACSVDWLGVPLTAGDRTIGVVAVQSYEEGVRYREIDGQTLEFVSAQIAMAIERRRAEDERQRILANLEEAQAVAHVGSWEYRPAGEAHLLVSAETLRIFGLPEGSPRRRPADFLSRVHPDDAESLARLARHALATEEGFELEVRLLGPKGDEERIVHGTAQVASREGTGVERLFGVVHDISERKRDERRLVEATEEMRRSIAALEERNREITLLSEMGRLLQACRVPEEVHAVTGRLGPQLFAGASGSLLVAERNAAALRVAASWGTAPPLLSWARDDCWALRLLRPHAAGEAADALRCAHLAHGGAASSLCVPLMAQGEPLGVLTLERSEHPGRSRTDARARSGPPAPGHEGGSGALPHEDLAATAAEQISLALANLALREILREQAIRDPLTGLFNRRYLEDALEREARRADRKGHCLGLLMIDLDHFKRFNDTHGHEAGDALLRAFGSFLRARIRAEDVACRYGGEEFVVLLPDCGPADLKRRAEEIRQRVRQIQVTVAAEDPAGVALSVGGAVYPGDAAGARELLGVADEALYRAKAGGRDRVVMAGTR